MTPSIINLLRPLPAEGTPDDSPAGALARRVLASPAPDDWAPTGIGREYYLDLMETIVRAAAGWQDAVGAIIDPVTRGEQGQTSPRYAAPGAILRAFGRVPELHDSICRTMDYACRRLAERDAQSPDFWTRELLTAYLCLLPLVEEGRAEGWRHDLSRVDPESTYVAVRPDGTELESLHNWTVYAAAGEWLRAAAGLAPAEYLCGEVFCAKYLPAQLAHFSPEGMYRDPGDPFTYDITTRLQFATMLAFGYQGPAAAELQALLRRAAPATLLFVTPEGYVPFGGRSSQFHFQEAIISALCELEAVRYKTADPALAGAFKRQARRSALAVRRWLCDMRPFRHLKNGFPPEAGVGRDPYGHYAVYSLFTASCFGLAALYADEEIAEAPCPAEIGGYLFALPEAFHKVFANCRGTCLEIDTRADAHYDATGLGRFCRAGVPLELGLGMPITATPSYVLPDAFRAGVPQAIGPAWLDGGRWTRLAELSEGLTATCEASEESPEHIAFTMTYTHEAVTITEAYTLREGQLAIRGDARRDGVRLPLRYHVPLLASDGAEQSSIQQAPATAEVAATTVRYRGATLAVTYDAEVAATVDELPVANRNGLYRDLMLADAQSVTLTLTPEPEATPPPAVPWYLREVKLDPRYFGIGKPMRIFLAITLPLIFLHAFTFKALWCLGWQYPFYCMSDFVPVCSAKGKWLAGGEWTRSKEIRVYGGEGTSDLQVVRAATYMQELVDELGLDFTVAAMSLPDDARRSLRVATTVRDGVPRLNFNKYTALRLDDRRNEYGEMFIIGERFTDPIAEGMTHFRAGIVAMRVTNRRPEVIVRHEGVHLLGYDKHDDYPFYILGYDEFEIPELRVTLMMFRTSTETELSARAKDALHYFWVGMEQRHRERYFRAADEP